MRLPLVRFRDDDSPTAWWEWLFGPVIIPAFILFLIAAAVVSLPWGLVIRARRRSQERRLISRLSAVGRYLDWPDVEARLRAGEGTLIIEHCSPKGPVREWWTADDIIAEAPVPLPQSLKTPVEDAILDVLVEFAQTCSSKYLDEKDGIAKLTRVPVPWRRALGPSDYVVVNIGSGWLTAVVLPTDRRLAEKYPNAKIVTLITWIPKPWVAAGDAEDVFLQSDPRDSLADSGR